MATALRFLYSQYRYLMEDLPDPRTQDWLFVGALWQVAVVITGYLYFVYVIGPAIMARRKQPVDLGIVLPIYNVFQIALNAYIAVQSILHGWFWKFKLICEPVDYSDNPEAIQVARLVWLFHLLKIFDLMDTAFFILRKKNNQVSFLHVYHHAGMVFSSWIGLRYLPGGHGTFLGLVNSVVHTIMYSHYLWTSLKLGKTWWKKYVTQIQLLQFFLIFCHYFLGVLTKGCGFPKLPLMLFLPQNLFITVLFADFYYKTYVKKKAPKSDRNGLSSTQKTEPQQNGVEGNLSKPKTS